ncbi:DUF4913 domain-containing protein [Streptomyces sp. NPDC001514]
MPVPGYLAEPSHDARWCHLWFEHSVAIARLHALWLAWQELTDPATCGYTGPSVWHRDHLDPCMGELRSPSGGTVLKFVYAPGGDAQGLPRIEREDPEVAEITFCSGAGRRCAGGAGRCGGRRHRRAPRGRGGRAPDTRA